MFSTKTNSKNKNPFLIVLFRTSVERSGELKQGTRLPIEDEFQILADRIANGGAALTMEESLAASKFFILWQVRVEQKGRPMADAAVRGVVPDPLTKDQRERLEKLGAAFINHDKTLLGRSVSGFHIFREIDLRLTQLMHPAGAS